MIKKIFNTDADRRRTVENLPVGIVMLWHDDAPPTGWLLCNGQEVPISSYQSLYNLITANATLFPYGANTNGSGGAGTSHFRLPDMTDKFSVISPSTGNAYSSLTKTGGSDNHSHNFSATPSNTDSSFNYHTHNFDPGNFGNSTAGNHTHAVSLSLGGDTNIAGNNAATSTRRAATGNTAAALMSHSHSASTNSSAAGDHSHEINVVAGGSNITNSDGHSHSIAYSSNAISVSAAHTPSHQRVYYIVLAADQ